MHSKNKTTLNTFLAERLKEHNFVDTILFVSGNEVILCNEINSSIVHDDLKI